MTSAINYHLLWLWAWFVVGEVTYMLKRAYYLVTGPNPVASTYSQFVARCWPPLVVRGVIGAGVYWLTFYPDVLNGALKYLGTSYQLHSPVPQYAVVALFFGLGVDNLLDFLLSKIPILSGWLPQMPGPLAKP